MARPKSAAYAQLQSLAGDPAAQAAYAVTLLDSRNSKDTMQAALTVLEAYPMREAREPLLRLLAYYGSDKGVRDQGAYFRRQLIEALRPLADRADTALLVQAATTYEFWPPDFAEDAVLLRSAALVVLAEVNEELARFYAARLLVDPYIQPMSGEPATTAAKVLGALGELPLLWAQAFTETAKTPEVTAECLRQMVELPDSLLPELLERFGAKAPSAVQLGLVDLLIQHRHGEAGLGYVHTTLQSTRDLDIYRYIVMSIVASGRESLLNELLAQANATQDRHKLSILEEALLLLNHQPRFAAMAAAVRKKLGPGGRP